MGVNTWKKRMAWEKLTIFYGFNSESTVNIGKLQSVWPEEPEDKIHNNHINWKVKGVGMGQKEETQGGRASYPV